VRGDVEALGRRGGGQGGWGHGVVSVDTTGFRDYQLHVRDLETGLDIASFGKARGIIWANDSDSLYIVTEDDAKRSDTIWRTSLSNPTERTIVFHEPDALFRVFATKTRDNAFIVLGTNSQTTSEFYTIPADDPKGTPVVVLPREDGHEYDLDHRDGLFYIRTNKNAPLFRIVAAPVSDPQEENWTEVLGADTETMRESVDCFGGHLVISERCGGRPQLRVLSFATGQDQLVAFPEPTYTVTLDQNHCFDTTTLRISYSSLVMPSSIYDVNLDTLESVVTIAPQSLEDLLALDARSREKAKDMVRRLSI
jgi:oligopeptidase B